MSSPSFHAAFGQETPSSVVTQNRYLAKIWERINFGVLGAHAVTATYPTFGSRGSSLAQNGSYGLESYVLQYTPSSCAQRREDTTRADCKWPTQLQRQINTGFSGLSANGPGSNKQAKQQSREVLSSYIDLLLEWKFKTNVELSTPPCVQLLLAATRTKLCLYIYSIYIYIYTVYTYICKNSI